MDIRTSLLDVTAQLFADHGWRGTTTRRIAEAAGVNEVTVFRHFGSKEALLREAIESAAMVGPLAVLPDEPGAIRAELLSWAGAIHAHVVGQRKLIRTALAEFEEHPEVAPVSCEGAMRAMEQMVGYLTKARARGLIADEGSLEGATMMLMNAIFLDGITRDVVPSCGAMTVPVTIEAFVDLTTRALGVSA
jgi:AcrR family transcriptional regulator